MSTKNIISIATFVRQQVEEWFKTEHHEHINTDTLGGACAVASFALVCALKSCGHEQAQFFCSYNDTRGHCWVEINGVVVDITATQFGSYFQKVHIFPKKQKHMWPFYNFPVTVKGLQAFDDFGQWIPCQNPDMYLSHVTKMLNNISV